MRSGRPSGGSSATLRPAARLTTIVSGARRRRRRLGPRPGARGLGPPRLERALAELGDEVERQIRPDGTGAEQAFAYQVFALDLLLAAVAFLDARGLRAPKPLCAGSSAPPMRCGRSSATMSPSAIWRLRRRPCAGSRRRGDALGARGNSRARRALAISAQRVAGVLDPMSLWLRRGRRREIRDGGSCRGAGAEKSDPAERRPDSPSGGGCRTLFDHGPHGYLTLAAHGHTDALAIDVALHEQPLVSDPGVGSFFSQPEVREAFRSTGFHATVTVDGSTARSLVDRSSGPDTRAAGSSTSIRGAAIAEHDGYTRLADPVLHRRAVVLIGNEGYPRRRSSAGDRAAPYSQRWPFHPSLEVADQGRNTSSCAASAQVRSSSSLHRATSTFASRADRRVRGSDGGRAGSSRLFPRGWHRWISKPRVGRARRARDPIRRRGPGRRQLRATTRASFRLVPRHARAGRGRDRARSRLVATVRPASRSDGAS